MTIKDFILYSILFILFIIVLLAIISKSACKKKSCKNCSTCSFGKCKCKDGYEGTDCEIDVRCKGKECKNSGSCVNGDCSCSNGWEGSDCGTRKLMSFNMSDRYTLKSKNGKELYRAESDDTYFRLYASNDTTTHDPAYFYFYDLTGKVDILKYNTRYNIGSIDTTNKWNTRIEPYGDYYDNGEILLCPRQFPWLFYGGIFYISPITGATIDKTSIYNIKKDTEFVIYIKNENGDEKYLKNNSTNGKITLGDFTATSSEQFIFKF